ncbi:Polyketide cyclase / dehydrase and lipid transport [Symmachiella macrocystis]|uniref:Polyketide cyclase / dehydrase and lipid transport n=1 Tax=Symmachiella macrocystis TaxID=2527985 RepID=A0A5C6B2X9_9PLAN|nr:SRPBCC family protein [Symmachiella macrocystis]TWU06675.1 Polyketide cyclase / dehydrase and lipid transport [Symmachiella macrocystis]
MTSPIRFTCENVLPDTPEDIAAHILELSNWPDFTGYGPLPGIKQAEFEIRTPEVVGTRIRASNCDGSSHVEEVIVWDLPRRLQLRMQDFSAPVSHIASHFDEFWEFAPANNGTQVTRSMELYAKSALTRPLLWLISKFLKRAIARHLCQLSGGG